MGLSNGSMARLTGTITCAESMRFRVAVLLSQDEMEGEGATRGTCTGDPSASG